MSKVTIAVPVYGVERYIERCARSLFEQTCQDVEYLFLDDCTPDKSIEVLKRVMEDYPERKQHVRIIRHEKNRGLGAARNTAVENCQTEFIMHVDSDDYIDTNLVEECMKQQQRGNYDIVVFDMTKHLCNKTVIWRNADFADADDLLKKMVAGHVKHTAHGKLIRTRLYIDNNIHVAEGINQAEDLMVAPKLAFYAKRVSQIHLPAYHYDMTNQSSCNNRFSRKKCEDQQRVFDDLFAFFKNDVEILDILKRKHIYTLNYQVKNSLRTGDMEYYKMLLQKLKSTDVDFINLLPKVERILYYLKGDKVRRAYIHTAYLMKQQN